ncbi:hypothetical protein [Embleya scabrispora]|uniref:hypothetical protein n=1 Tax=Embleya scabrispora TaxID=159449 RepID=UPI00036068C4|nr:hypothetical protein [Embleya scabrispora]MYS85548.1 hypothetical protein [Streptomyces sp. SID5474]
MRTALGVAVLGSILSGTYTGAMPDSAPEQARQSISDALALADASGEHALADTAREAFTSAMSALFWAGAACVLAASALALILIRDPKPHASTADAPTADASTADACTPPQAASAARGPDDRVGRVTTDGNGRRVMVVSGS